MHLFRMRLILALILSVTVVSLAFTYFDVLAHRHILRGELERRTQWMGVSLLPDIQGALGTGDPSSLSGLTQLLKSGTGALALAVYDTDGRILSSAGPGLVLHALPEQVVANAIQKGMQISRFGHTGDQEWLEEAFPLHDGLKADGSLVIVADANYIRSAGNDLWRRSFWRALAIMVLIVAITLGMIRWFLLRPMTQVVERLRRLRLKAAHPEKSAGQGVADLGVHELSLFTPLAREVETMAKSLMAARAAAAAEARLREAGEHLWTAERLAVHIRDRHGSSRIFVVSNREPYMHVRQGWETKCVVPPSGLVTALEPVLRACDGVWVAYGSGNADAATVDAFDRLRVPPDDPRYTLRRVWLTEEEEAQYYDGFANEGLWPLCHIAHTRPIFRPADWECYRQVNARFAAALLEEMQGCDDPVVFVQDYHFALLPRMVKEARPDARVAIFWHIPWPNPEAFGICPWQAELLDGLLGADLIGFHIPLHCNNFLATVDRTLESRTSREHMTVRRHGHTSSVRPYPVSVSFAGTPRDDVELAEAAEEAEAEADAEERALRRRELLAGFGIRADCLLLGVDRLDYTKGIVERLLAVEQLLDEHPRYRGQLTMVQIAAPSRTRIRSYAELKTRVEETVARINQTYQTARWKPILLIERQCSHEEVNLWYRTADVCLVTSLHDGMNLVAKEYVASREDCDGVLVLSKFTGAAVELRDALIVNPYDIAAVAEAVHSGLEMNRADRRQRMKRMRRYIMEHNIYLWAAKVLGDLREIRIEYDVNAQPPRVEPGSEPAPEIPEERLA
ncbi:MAG TPA: trehalose-6-phosphate synthase [Terracidiphilus sp.]|nr:trehalose-6-phosphate synthase [Terracidiphilus sp.]